MNINLAAGLQPPNPKDTGLLDYTANIKKILLALSQDDHIHLGINGVLTTFPSSITGNPGDILIAVVNGTSYLCFKTDKTHWFKIAGVGV